MNETAITDAVKQIHAVLSRELFGGPNEAAKEEIFRLASIIEYHSDHDTYIGGKLASLRDFTEILYSARKHRKYSTDAANGDERVKQFVYSDATNIGRWLRTRKNMERLKEDDP